MNRLKVLLLVLSIVGSAFAGQTPLSLSVNRIDNRNFTITTQFDGGLETAQAMLESEGSVDTEDGSLLPVITRWVALPDGYKIVTRVTDRQSYWAETGFSTTGIEVPVTRPEDLPLDPPFAVTTGSSFELRGIRMVPVSIFPFQRSVNGATTLANRSMTIHIDFVTDPIADEIQFPIKDNPNSSIAKMMDKMLLNPPSRDMDEMQGTAFEKILIVHQGDAGFMGNVGPYIDSLATWKRQLGYQVDTIIVDPNGSAQQIRTRILEHFNVAPGKLPLSYCILIGSDDGNIKIPTYKYADGIDGDHFYAVANADQPRVAHFAVGRMQATSYDELKGVIMRSIFYERQPYKGDDGNDPSWFGKALYSAENIAAPGGQFVPSMIHLGRWFWMQFNRQGFTKIDTLWVGDQRDITRSVLEDGRSVAFSRGWLYGSLTNDASKTPARTGRRNPLAITVTCLSYGEQEIFFRSGVAYRPAEPNRLQGPIASLTMDGLTNTKTNNSLSGGIIKALSIGKIRMPGLLQLYGKHQMLNDYRFDDDETFQGYMLTTMMYFRCLGDPSVGILMGAPETFQVTAPATITPGTTGLDVEVKIRGEVSEEAIVCFWQKATNVHLVTTPGADGWARFTLPKGQLQAGNAMLTVSRHDAFTYVGNIAIVAGNPQVDLEQVSYDWGQQNPQHLFGAGYNIPTTLTFKNNGQSAAQNVVVNLASEYELMSFDPAQINVGSLNAGESKQANFNLVFNRSSKGGIKARIGVNVAGDNNLKANHAIELTTSGATLVLHQLAGNPLQPGQGVDITPSLRNTGDLPTPALNVIVASLDGKAVITRNNLSFAPVLVGPIASPDAGRLQIKINEKVIPGNMAKFSMTLQGGDGLGAYSETIYFERVIGQRQATDPSGPDDYGYLCFDSRDDEGGWAKAPTYKWREINPAKPTADFKGTFLPHGDFDEDFDSSLVVALPEGFTFQYYGEEFDTLIICSNGWIAFGAENSMFVDFRNWQLPGIQGPDAMVAAMWQDLINPQPGDRGVFYHYAEEEGIFIIEWSEMEILGAARDLVEFQILLYDSEQWVTPTGDGEIKIQYKHFIADRGMATDNYFSTIGLKNLDGTDGLEYTWWNNYDASLGSRPISDGMALLFTTDTELRVGSVTGTVRDSVNNQPMQGVQISIEPAGLTAVSGANGSFSVANIPIGEHVLFANLQYHNRIMVEGVVVTEADTSVINFKMTKPAIQVSTVEITPPAVGQGDQKLLEIPVTNNGNGDLNITLSSRYADGKPISYSQKSQISMAGLVSDRYIRGGEFIGDLLYVTGSNRGEEEDDNTETNYIYVIDRNGTLKNTLVQPSRKVEGFFDLAYDGNNLYAGETRADSTSWLTIFTPEMVKVAEKIIVTRANELNFPRALAYCPDKGTILVASELSYIFELKVHDDSDSVEVVGKYDIHLPGEKLFITGLAWNPLDPEAPLYILDQAGTDVTGRMRLLRCNPWTGRLRVVAQLAQNGFDYGTGLAIGFNWKQGTVSMMAVGNDDTGYDFLRLYELGPDSRFLQYESEVITVPAGQTVNIPITLNAVGLDTIEYVAGLHLSHNATGDSATIPIRLRIIPTSVDDNGGLIAHEFSLASAYPNPFNSMTRLAFNLRNEGHTRLAVYDLNGRLVTTLVDDVLKAGTHALVFDSAGLPSGVYLYRLESGGASAVKKMVLVR